MMFYSKESDFNIDEEYKSFILSYCNGYTYNTTYNYITKRDYSKGDVYDKVVQALSKDYKEYDLEISHESSLIDYNFLKK